MNISLIHIAFSQFGVTEITGKRHNPSILNYFHAIGHKWVTTDETAWCSAFANWVALRSGLEYSGELNARSWLKTGCPVPTPEMGDVVVFWREDPKSWKGHVGFFINYSEDRKWIYCLGGNQSNQVNIKAYPAARVLGFRHLSTWNP
jgi:uncharacterized protein (TIGR02594 family)